MDGKAPEIAVSILLEFKEYSWKPLSSYVHGGIHAMRRREKGYPVPLLEQVVRASNGVTLMTGMVWVILSNNPMLTGAIPSIQRDLQTVYPIPDRWSASEPPQLRRV